MDREKMPPKKEFTIKGSFELKKAIKYALRSGLFFKMQRRRERNNES